MQKYPHLNRNVKNGAIHIPIKKNGSVINGFLGKRGLIVYLAALRGLFGPHILTMSYIGSYSPPPELLCKKEKQAIKQSK